MGRIYLSKEVGKKILNKAKKMCKGTEKGRHFLFSWI